MLAEDGGGGLVTVDHHVDVQLTHVSAVHVVVESQALAAAEGLEFGAGHDGLVARMTRGRGLDVSVVS